MAIEAVLLTAAILLVLGVVASKASGRLGVPALLLFLAVGMLAGSEGPGGIAFDDAGLAQSLGVVALATILFAGGLETRWKSIRPVLWQGITLATLGVLLTSILTGLFAHFVLGLPVLVVLLLGSIVSSTDAAAVFAVLRSRNVRLKPRLKSLLELESGSNDPMAVFLTLGFVVLLQDPQAGWGGLATGFLVQMTLGAAMGWTMGRVMGLALNHARLGYDGLYSVLSVALLLLTYSATSLLGGNGFLAVYVAGLVLGNSVFIHKTSILRYHDGLAWLMQIAMFLALGLLVFPSRLWAVADAGVLLSAFLLVVARPASVFVSLLPFRLPLREAAYVSWTGLRGAVPIILATFPLLAGVPHADTLFNLVFFVVLTSVLVQGPTINPLARLLRVEAPLGHREIPAIESVMERGLQGELSELVLPRGAAAAGKQVMGLGLPEGVLVALVDRGGHFIVPRGNTVLEEGDRLLVVADARQLEAAVALLGPPAPA